MIPMLIMTTGEVGVVVVQVPMTKMLMTTMSTMIHEARMVARLVEQGVDALPVWTWEKVLGDGVESGHG